MAGQPKELNELAFHLVKVATGQADKEDVTGGETRNLAAVELGRRGGLKGGPARAKSLSAKRRSEIAKKAADTRWKSNSS